MLCYRCGSHVPDGSEVCGSCGQRFDGNLRGGKAGTVQKRKLSELESAGVRIGEILADRYEVRSLVGQGPVGSVLRAGDREVDVEIALKLISPRLLQTPEERLDFNKALKQAKKLSHPNIIRIYEIGALEGGEGAPSPRPFFTMQLLNGLTLRRVIDLRRDKNQLFALREVEPILAQVALALEHAAPAGAHGDLKPDNVIVLPDLLKVTDFGLATALPRVPFVAAQRARKTDVYLAPEFLAGHAIEPSADVYSMGVILGEMLSGQLPIAGRLPDLLAANPDLPPAVEGLYRRCLAANPTSRVPSAAEFASELLALSEASAPPIPKPGAAGVVVAPLPPSGPTIPKARPRPPPPPPREPSGDIVLHTGDFEVRTDVDEQFTPPDSGPKLPPSPPTIVDRQGTRPSRIARPLRPVREPHPPREPGAIPIDTPGNISRGNISRPRPTPSAPPVADAGAKRRRWIIIGVIAALLVGVGLYGGVRALLSWQAKEKSQLEAQIRADFERQQRLLAAQAADAGTGTVTPPPAPDAGHPPLAVAAPDAGPKRTPPTPPSNPTPPSHPPREHEEHVIVAHEVAAGGCPEGMRTVRGGAFRMGTPGSDDLGNFGDRPERRVSVRSYCIDAYEYPNQADVKPKVGVTLSAAETACASEGKRLCSEEEWEKACKGPDNLRFPYGHAFSSQACNGGRGGLAAAGSFAGCKSGYGVYDLSGNAAEWTSSRFQSGASDRAVKGGSFGRSDTDLRCSARQNKAPGSHSGDVGFRCCEDLK